MKKMIALLLSIVTLISFVQFSQISVAAQTVYKVSDIQGKYKTQGRTEVEGGILRLDWSASGMIFTADCSGDVLITVEPTRINTDAKAGVYFTVIVDGKVQSENKRIPTDNKAENWTSNSTRYPFHITQNGESTFTIATGLSNGKHTFEIYNQTEAMDGSFGIKSITLNGSITTPPANNNLYIEFVGDSTTAGLGNISVGGNGAALYQDATRGWAYLTAQKLNADWSIIAQSGITATTGIGWGTNSRAMPEMYQKLRYEPNNSKMYGFESQPDVIVVGLGTNDMWTYRDCGATEETVLEGFKTLLKLIREKNPKAKIIWIHNLMNGSVSSIATSAVNAMGGANKGFYSLKLTVDTSGGQGHPGLAVQSKWADTLSAYINSLLNESSNTSDKPSSNNTTSSNNTSQNSSINASQNSSGDSQVTSKNTDKKLASLEVVGYELSEEFSPNINYYDVYIPYDAKNIDIKATPMDANSTITVTGDKNLKTGKESTATIICTASTGEWELYIINIRRLENDKTKQVQTNSSSKFLNVWIILICAVVLVVVIATILFFCKFKKGNKN